MLRKIMFYILFSIQHIPYVHQHFKDKIVEQDQLLHDPTTVFSNLEGITLEN